MPSSAEPPLDGELESENDKSASPAKAATPPVFDIDVNCADSTLTSPDTRAKIVDALRASGVCAMLSAASAPTASNEGVEKGVATYLVLLARIVASGVSQRKVKQIPNSRILACCRAALFLDAKNERGMIEFAWELYHRKEYENVFELERLSRFKLVMEDVSAVLSEGRTVVALSGEKREQLTVNHKSPTERPLTASSPVKAIKGLGDRKASEMSPSKDPNVKICDAVFPENDTKKTPAHKLVEEISKATRLTLNLKETLSENLVREIEGLLQPSDGKFKVVSWNARASLGTHGLTPAVLAKKTANLAAAVRRESRVSIICIQECPHGRLAETAGPETFDVLLARELDCFDVRPIECRGLGKTSKGETHVVAWDPQIWQLEASSDNPRALEDDELRRAIGLTILQTVPTSKAEPVKRLALLSCHLKSGGKDDTKRDLRTLSEIIVPKVQASLQSGDAVLVLGDFNLAPTHDAFEKLTRLGFQNIGSRDGESTNQSDFVDVGGKIYDSAWLWRSGVAAGFSSGVVLESEDAQNAVEERKQMLDVFKGVYDQIKASSELGSGAKDVLLGDGKGSIAQAVKAAFKTQVYENWSDHKPICLEVALS